MNEEYILLAGYRRLNAIKKLGWTKVSAKLHNNDKLVELDVKNIALGENSRKEESSQEIVELMESIKQNGLLQPIVVVETKNLTEEDFISLNLTENLQRKDLSPFEISLRIKRLKQIGLNEGEIAVRLGMNKDRIRHLSDMASSFEEKDMKNVQFIEGKDTKGKIPYTTAKIIAQSRLTKAQKRELLNKAKDKELKTEQVELIVRLIHLGFSISKAIEQNELYTRMHPSLVINIKEIDNLVEKYQLKNRTAVFHKIMSGEIPAQPQAFFIPKEQD